MSFLAELLRRNVMDCGNACTVAHLSDAKGRTATVDGVDEGLGPITAAARLYP